MPETAPCGLKIRHGEREQEVVREGDRLPAQARIVMATQRPGQKAIDFDMIEDDGSLLAATVLKLPPGLPANCWIPVFFAVSAEGMVRVEARENLRRLNIQGDCDTEGCLASFYKA